MERKVLGRGLAALIPEKELDKREKIIYLKVDQIRPGKYQPREDFDAQRLEELISSIKEKGVIQPILVRSCTPGEYEIIAGERRLRAAKALKMEEIPAIFKSVGDDEALELSIVENIQREELNSIEQAHAYQRLIDEFDFTQDKIAETIGKDRSSVANTIRLLKLPQEVQSRLKSGEISMGHARAILSLEGEAEQVRICRWIISKGLSVRELENLIRNKLTQKRRKLPVKAEKKDLHVRTLEEELQHILGTRVKIILGRKRGKIQIEFYSTEDLERILNIFKK
jgi:ParB family chromosome partitioning protein